jgi:copper oxidase (laccase) domain-containing protein
VSDFIVDSVASVNRGTFKGLGCRHGFFGRGDEAVVGSIKSIFSVGELITLKQVHGNRLVDLRCSNTASLAELDALLAGELEADGFILPLDARQLCIRGLDRIDAVGFAVRTADCLPIVLVGRDELALIHAGWRGLANGILQQAVNFFEAPPKAFIGPAADPALYEVGHEVIEQIHGACFSDLNRDGKFALDLVASATFQLRGCGVKEVSSSSVSTISDPRYYSHRRGDTGRNITTVVLEPGQELC